MCEKGIITRRFFKAFLLQEEIVSSEWHFIDSPEDLTIDLLEKIKPEYVFFPHWSWIIPKEIWEKYCCVVFHVGDVPEGRGGSPIQNHIARGVYDTFLSAIKVDGGIDTGPVYGKWPVSLRHGTVEEILLAVSEIIFHCAIPFIVQKKPAPMAQSDKGSFFSRRTPSDGDMSSLSSLDQAYDWIRMLDGTGYPPAFLDIGPFHLEFSRVSKRSGEVLADVRFSLRRDETDE